MAAGYAARFADRFAAVPQDARIWIFPIDREGFIHLDILACLYATAAKQTLIRIVPVERVRGVNFVRLGLERDFLMFDLQQLGRVVDCAIPVVVVADRAVQHVVGEDHVERLPLRGICPHRLGLNPHLVGNCGCACPD